MSVCYRYKSVIHDVIDSRKLKNCEYYWIQSNLVFCFLQVLMRITLFIIQRREKEFDDYLREKYVNAKAEFRELLKETKLITYNSRAKLQESDSHMNDIVKILEVSWPYC